VELRHLRYFVVLADELHFGRAAERLYIVQPALSKQIASFERELGVQLFTRNRRKVELTPAGETLLPKAREILHDASEMMETARRVAAGDSGAVEFGFIAPACLAYVARVLRIHSQSHPLVTVGLTEAGTSRLLEELEQGRIDLALCRTPKSMPPWLTSHMTIEEPVLLALPEDHPFATELAIPFARLEGEPVIQISQRTDSDNGDYYAALAVEAGFDLCVTQEADHLHMALALVASGLGATFVPAFAKSLLPHGVITIGITDPAPVLQMSVLTRQARVTPVLSEFANSVQKALENQANPEDKAARSKAV
jgi:DNA-binding transcriptional LysR family regulator